jgi:CheY-like chemotaxis protein
MSETARPILAAEDEESDRLLLDLAFRKAKLQRPLVIVRDGQEAVDYLRQAGNALPALIILDLKMPRMNGFDVMAWLMERPEFKDIPVVALSSSGDEADVNKARQLGAREYFVKPHRLENLIQIAQQMQTHWLNFEQNGT